MKQYRIIIEIDGVSDEEIPEVAGRARAWMTMVESTHGHPALLESTWRVTISDRGPEERARILDELAKVL